VGESHVRVRLRSLEGSFVNAIAFRAADKPLGRALIEHRGRAVHAAGCLAIDRYQGTERVQFRVIDIAPA
jgi:single-stranded-DNA-specific exonuclease